MTGTLANLIAFLLFHYAFVGSKLKRNRIGKEINDSGKRKNLIDLSVIIHKLGSFNLLAYCEKNASKHENTYIPFGVFSILFMVCNSILLDADLYKENLVLMNIVQGLVLGLSTLLITYKLWLEALKRKHVALVWYVTIFISSVVSSIVLIAGSDTILMPLMVFSINLLVISYLLKWQETILMLLCGMIIAYIGCCCYFDKSVTDLNFSASKFSIMYFFLMLTSSFIFFLKPKQEYLEATEQKADALEGEKAILDHKVADLDTQVKTLEVQKVRLTGDVTALGLQVRSVKDERAKLIHEVSNLGAHVTNLEGEKARLNSQITGLSAEVTDLASQVGDLNEQVTHYTEQIADKDKEIDRLGQTSQRILNNVSHELRLPIGNVVNFSEMLTETLGKTENNKLMKELAKEVYDNSNRVSSMILNMLDLATLAVKKVDLEKTMVNFSELVLERVRRCQKIYQNSKNIEFKLDIEPEILISVDPNYMRQTVDNLVINSITFSKQGLITISVTKKDGEVIFTITDQGVGIPDGQLTDIFTPFKMGANTESKAQGRGVGLALCKSAIEAHGGSIIANSDGECGAELQFTLPFKNNQ
jgi:signal transduction histidine kinase